MLFGSQDGARGNISWWTHFALAIYICPPEVVVGPAAPTLPGDKFPNIDRIRDVRCPVFIAHGEQDEIVPIEHGKKLYETLQIPFRTRSFFVDDMSHNYHGYKVEVAMMKEINAYLDYHILARQLWMKH